MLAEHRLRIPLRREIVDELRHFEYTITPSKRLKMEASQGYDDIVMSLARGAHKALIPRTLGPFRSVSTIRQPNRQEVDLWVAAFQ